MPLKDEVKRKNDEFGTLTKELKVSIPFTDFVEELSRLTGISILNMKIKVDVSNYINDNGKLMCHRKPFCDVSICEESELDDYQSPFSYKIVYPVSMDEKQGDGKTLEEHCNRKLNVLETYASVSVNKRIGDIICHFDTKTTKINNGELCISNGLLAEVIINCIKQGKYVSLKVKDETEKQRVLKKIIWFRKEKEMNLKKKSVF